jgi:tripartite-type tricarboxylate transporter receptor subunit TctC
MIRHASSGAALSLAFAASLCVAAQSPADKAASAGAKDYPDRPIRLILPYPPGGNTEILARALGPRMTESWGKPVVVDTRGGGNGVIATEIVARSAPDGYTVFLGSTREISVNPLLLANVPYDVNRDFAPVAMGTITPILLAGHPTFAPRTVKEVIAAAKSDPKGLTYATPGTGTSMHLSGELLNLMGGIRSVHVPYKGGGPAVLAVVSGEVKFGYLGMGPAIPHVKANRLRAIAITTARRAELLPDVPTMIESGLKDFETSIWFAFFVPSRTPKAIIAKLNGEIVRILKTKDMNDFLLSTGVEVAPSTPEELAAIVKRDAVKYREIIKVAGVKAD